MTTSDEFNNKCGGSLDEKLSEAFAPLVNFLSPLLASEHKAGKMPVQIRGQRGRYVVQGGVLGLSGLQIIPDPETNKPRGVSASSRQALEKFSEKHGLGVSFLPDTAASESTTVVYRQAALAPEIEIAVCKCTLSTFDHFLANEKSNFCRHPALQAVRDSIRDVAMGGASPREFAEHFCWGIDYSARTRIHEIIDKCSIASRLDQFAHVLIACGDVASHSVSLVFAVFGFEPYRFCLTRDWTEGAFCYFVTNDVIKNGQPAALETCPFDYYIGPRNSYRSIVPQDMMEEEMHTNALTIGLMRKTAIQEAIELVEMRSDEFVRLAIENHARFRLATEDEPALIRAAFEAHLYLAYEDHLREISDLEEFQSIISSSIMSLKVEERARKIGNDGTGSDAVNWGEWIRADREALRNLKSRFGLPGAFFGHEVIIANESHIQ